MEDIYVANTIFAINFFKQLANASPTQNLFFSPWGISSTMVMVYMGARGNTSDQMARVSFCGRSTQGLSGSQLSCSDCVLEIS